MAIKTVQQFLRFLHCQESTYLLGAFKSNHYIFQYKKKIDTYAKVNGCKQPAELT